MESAKQKIYLIRHGETEWTLSGQHTGSTDIPLTPNGEKQAALLGEKLRRFKISAVFTSPLQRAKRTCEVAGLLKTAKIEPDLVEWNYGDYEGLTTPQIWQKQPGWTIFSQPPPQGESFSEISQRAQRVLDNIRSIQGDVALFSHGHFLRVICASWLNLSPQEGRLFALDPGSLSILGFERNTPVLRLWNETSS